MPGRTRPPGCFKNGEQGVVNYVINQKVMLGEVAVERRKILRYPPFGYERAGRGDRFTAYGGAGYGPLGRHEEESAPTAHASSGATRVL
jgi:hypothetical protein